MFEWLNVKADRMEKIGEVLLWPFKFINEELKNKNDQSKEKNKHYKTTKEKQINIALFQNIHQKNQHNARDFLNKLKEEEKKQSPQRVQLQDRGLNQ